MIPYFELFFKIITYKLFYFFGVKKPDIAEFPNVRK